MWKQRILAVIVLLLAVTIGGLVYTTEKKQTKQFALGLDLSGGVHLTYNADVSKVAQSDLRESLDALRDVIERRINLFGVSEPNVQIEKSAFAQKGDEYRLIIELPGVTDVNKAIEMIGQTPLLEFKTENPKYTPSSNGEVPELTITPDMIHNGQIDLSAALDSRVPYIDTKLTGQYLQRASVQFNQQTHAPIVALQFNSEGSKMFEELTKENIGKTIAIYLDGAPISTPVVQTAISGGQAVITGNFTPEEAKILVGRLNSGALPVPVSLEATETIGPSLGAGAVHDGVMAGIVGFLVICLFLIVWYRLPGLLASLALVSYAAIVLALFKYVPVTLTSAGIAGFIISIGVAVDGNILIFERMKEEMKKGKTLPEAIKIGFSRAWSSIRDSNLSSIISAIVLFWFGSSLIKGFALTLGIGIIVSMLSAITISRILLRAVAGNSNNKTIRFLFSSGLSK